MKHDNIPVLIIASMFLTVGVMFCMNDILLPVAKDLFSLTYLQSTLIQVTFYAVYVIWPMPISRWIERHGYRKNIIAAMFVCIAGCMLFVMAYFFRSYTLILLGVFIISTGVTIVNVAANPYAAMLGSSDGASMRLNFVQAFSRVGYAITPVLATPLIGTVAGEPRFHLPYVGLALLISVVIILMYAFGMPDHKPNAMDGFSFTATVRQSTHYRQLVYGIPTMFFYVGAEACTAGFFISYMTTHGYRMTTAATFLTLYYVLAAIGALAGTAMLKYVRPGTLLAFSGIGMLSCFAFVVLAGGTAGAYALIGGGAFLSVMFPTVFGLAIENLRDFTGKGSALLNFAIVGGAVFPPLQGWLADHGSIDTSYLVPAACIIVVSFYGFSIKRLSKVPIAVPEDKQGINR